MGVSITAIGAYFAEAGTASALAAGTEAGVATGGLGLASGGATAASIAAGGAEGGGLSLAAIGTSAASAAATAGVTSLLAPKPPKIPGATPMPDEQAQMEARKRSIAEQMARRGRASTILTEPASGGTLGG